MMVSKSWNAFSGTGCAHCFICESSGPPVIFYWVPCCKAMVHVAETHGAPRWYQHPQAWMELKVQKVLMLRKGFVLPPFPPQALFQAWPQALLPPQAQAH